MKISNWNDLNNFIEKSSPNHLDTLLNHTIFRGQSNYEWKLETSLSRIVNGSSLSEQKAEFYEKQAQMDFISQAHTTNEKISFDSSPMSLDVIMQHYSCPTRLLDWSESPYIALYFAINNSFHTDGAFYAWDDRFYQKRMKHKYENYSSIEGSDIINFSDYEIVQIVQSTRKNERLIRQQGIFSVSNNLIKNHCDLIDSEKKESSGLYKIKIPKELKFEFLARLRKMNITAESLFPGLDGIGKSISEKLVLRR